MNDADPTNQYFIDPESSAEMARLRQQGRLLTKAAGGLLPEYSDLSRFHRVLDAACGSGEWVLDLAFATPTLEVVGVDISQRMIEYAKSQAHLQHLGNARFEVMNITNTLDFPDQSFDLINARAIAGVLLRVSWPPFLQECQRLLRPGGVIRLTECDVWATTTSSAQERLHAMAMHACKIAGLGFSPDGRTLGMTPMMKRLLQHIGCHNIRERAWVNDFSAGEPAHEGMYTNLMAYYKLAQPAFVRHGVATQAELDVLYQQMLREIHASDFCAMGLFLTAWGEIPLE